MKKLMSFMFVMLLAIALEGAVSAGGGGEGYGTVSLEDCKDNNLLVLSDVNQNTDQWPYRIDEPDHCIHIYNNAYGGSSGQFHYSLPKADRAATNYYSDDQLEGLEVLDELEDGDQVYFSFYSTGGDLNSDGTRGYLITEIQELNVMDSSEQAVVINLYSYPFLDSGSYDTDLGKINAEVGDVIEFYYDTPYLNGVVELGEENWKYDEEYLECNDEGESFYDNVENVIFCEVVKSGSSWVTVGFQPKMEDGTTWMHDSNIIWVSGGEEDEDPVDISVVEEGGEIPPAGYEDEVLTAFDVYDNPFPDTDLAKLEGMAAAELYRRAVIGGYPDGEFKGYKLVNRAETAKFLLLARYAAVEEISNDGKFTDVLDGQWYTKFVVTAANFGIIDGYPDGTFRPADYVNTAEFIKMLTLTFGLELNLPYDYEDVGAGDWFAQYAGTVEKYELFPLRTDKLLPASELNRNEVAVAIYQFLKNR